MLNKSNTKSTIPATLKTQKQTQKAFTKQIIGIRIKMSQTIGGITMIWETVKIKNERKGRTMPYASVGFGRLSLSTAACDLVDGYESFEYVELLKAVVNNETLIGVRFLTEAEKTTNSLPIKRRKLKNGSVVGGIDICNKGTMAELFGLAGTQNKATRYGVKKDPDEANILIIFGEK